MFFLSAYINKANLFLFASRGEIISFILLQSFEGRVLIFSEVFFFSRGREGTPFLFFLLLPRWSKHTPQRRNERYKTRILIILSLKLSLSAIKNAPLVVIKRDVFTLFFVFFSRCECLDEDETTTTTTE